MRPRRGGRRNAAPASHLANSLEAAMLPGVVDPHRPRPGLLDPVENRMTSSPSRPRESWSFQRFARTGWRSCGDVGSHVSPPVFRKLTISR